MNGEISVKTIHAWFIGVVVCVTAMSAQAADVVLVSSLIPYDTGSTASEDVRKECTWNTTMPRYLAKQSNGLVKVSEQSIDTVTDKKLVLAATYIHTAGGGNWSGPKWLALQGRLMEGNKLLGSFEVRRQTIRGSLRACGTLDSLSEDVADDILGWLKAPSLDAKLGDAK
jgi:hypothetical protein